MFFQPYDHHLKPNRLVWRSPRVEDAIDRGVDPEILGREKTEKAIKETHTKQEELRNDVELGLEVTDKLLDKKEAILKFIEEHQDYKSGDWRQWNEEFLKMMGEEDSQFIDHIQLKLFGDRAKVDSKLGPETLKALSSYLISGLDSKKVARIRDVRKIEVTEMLSDLDKEELFKLYKKALTNGLDQVSDDLEISDEMDALELLPKQKFFEVINDVISKNGSKIDMSSAEGWRDAFKRAGLTNNEVENLGLNAKLEETEVKNKKEEAVVETLKSHEKIRTNVDKSDEVVEGPIRLFERESKRMKQYLESSESYSIGKGRVLENLKYLKDNPDAWDNVLYSRKSYLKAPYEAFEQYKIKYEAFKKAEESGSNFKDEFEAKELAYDNVEKAVSHFFDKQVAIVDETQADYERGLKEISKKYDFPKGMPLELFNDPEKAPAVFRNNPVTRYLDEKGLDIITNNVLPRIIAKYYNRENALEGSLNLPKRVITSQSDFLPFLNGVDEFEKVYNANNLWKDIKTYNREPVITINAWIYYNNALRFASENQALLNKLRSARDEKISTVQNMPLEELLK